MVGDLVAIVAARCRAELAVLRLGSPFDQSKYGHAGGCLLNRFDGRLVIVFPEGRLLRLEPDGAATMVTLAADIRDFGLYLR
jgi:hypothetical protein